MARFERSSGRRDSDNRSNRGRRDSRGGFQRNDRRDSDRGFRPNNRDRNEVKMTKAICSSCGTECEVPFKPTSSKPVYCDSCFSKKGKSSSDRDFDLINEKLNKIMKALKIE